VRYAIMLFIDNNGSTNCNYNEVLDRVLCFMHLDL